jgi:hypothetical protein
MSSIYYSRWIYELIIAVFVKVLDHSHKIIHCSHDKYRIQAFIPRGRNHVYFAIAAYQITGSYCIDLLSDCGVISQQDKNTPGMIFEDSKHQLMTNPDHRFFRI